jgi:hypothetical protein
MAALELPKCGNCHMEYDLVCRTPHSLHCGHTFCLWCIKKHLRNSNKSITGKAIVCFSCEKKNLLGFDGFPRGIRVLQAHVIKKRERPESEPEEDEKGEEKKQRSQDDGEKEVAVELIKDHRETSRAVQYPNPPCHCAFEQVERLGCQDCKVNFCDDCFKTSHAHIDRHHGGGHFNIAPYPLCDLHKETPATHMSYSNEGRSDACRLLCAECMSTATQTFDPIVPTFEQYLTRYRLHEEEYRNWYQRPYLYPKPE